MTACPFCNAPYPEGRPSIRFCGKCGRRQPDPSLSQGTARANRPTRRLGPRPPAVDPRAEPGSTGQVRVERVSTQMERVREPEHPTLVMDRVREPEHPTLELGLPPVDRGDNPTIEMPLPRSGARGTLVMEPKAPLPVTPAKKEQPGPTSGFRVEHREPTPSALEDTGPHDLGSDETLVLLSFDDNLSLEEMSSATGLPAQRVHQIVRKLRRLGVLEVSAPVDEPAPDSVTSPKLDPPPAQTAAKGYDEDLYPPTFVDDARDLDAPTFVDTPIEDTDDDEDITGKRAAPPSGPSASADADDDDDDDESATMRRERKRLKYRPPIRREEDGQGPEALAPASPDLTAASDDAEGEPAPPASRPPKRAEGAKTKEATGDAATEVTGKPDARPSAKPEPPKSGETQAGAAETSAPAEAKTSAPAEEAKTNAAAKGAATAAAAPPAVTKTDGRGAAKAAPADPAGERQGDERASTDEAREAEADAPANEDGDDAGPHAALAEGLDQDADGHTHVDDRGADGDEGEGDAKDDGGDEVGPEGVNYRKIYETELHPLPIDERIELAGKSSGNTLMALCFDQNARVLKSLIENTAANVEHARLAAFHHRTSMGLEAIAARGDYVRDPQVQRRLTRNPMLPEPVLRRILMGRRLVEVYKFTCDHDVPERSRTASRGILRRRFATAQPEERVELIWKTEGRVLVGLAGATFDSKTTAMLCARNYVSVMLIQSLARFPATPPTLIAHLLKQPMVKRQPHLKNMLVRHPNTPSDVKRRL